MGIKKTVLPYIVFLAGLTGTTAGILLQWWTNAVDYPYLISGKPLFSWPAFVPIMFECGVLGGAMGALLGFLHFARLPQHHHPIFNSTRFERFSDDRFFISVETADPEFDPAATRALLESAGALGIEEVAA